MCVGLFDELINKTMEYIIMKYIVSFQLLLSFQ